MMRSSCWQPIAMSAHCVRSLLEFARAFFPEKTSRTRLGTTPTHFPAMYIALVRVGEASGTLEATCLQVLARERTRAESLRRKLADALRYPAFVLFAALCRADFLS